jgi:thiamine-monophosphate kinase
VAAAIDGRAAGLGLGPGREFDLIREFFRDTPPTPHPSVLVGPGDDCAVVAGPRLALSCDLSVEGVHFRRDWLTDTEIGYRATSAALSDLAAAAAAPIGVMAALALPEGAAGSSRALMAGVTAAAARAGAVVLGGDVSRTEGPMVLDVIVVGSSGEPVVRSGAAPGDELWVTGRLGAAAAAVALLERGERPDAALRERFAAPEPRHREALWLRERGVLRALIDLSDGLAGDAGHLAAASGAAAVIEVGSLPVHPAAARVASSAAEAVRLALAGGEDYELAFAAAPGATEPLVEPFHREFRLELTRVGRFEAGTGVWLEDADGGRSAAGAGFQHFGAPS